nr:hypothetical protein [Tanacetum cinerariifolium]
MFELGESFTVAPTLPVTSEHIPHTIPLLAARLVRHEDQIYEVKEHLKELSFKRVESMALELEILCDRADTTKHK